jgi:hypothetical protein
MGDNATVLVRAKMNWGGLRYDEIGLVDAAQAEPLLEDGRLELAWAAYAASQKVPVGDSDSREQIIEALEAAGKPT